MTNPVKPQFHIKLVTSELLDHSYVRRWYNLAKQALPNGIQIGSQVLHPREGLQSVRLMHVKLKSGQHEYIIPLGRHLTDTEYQVVKAETENHFDQAHQLESSAPKINDIDQMPDGHPQIKPDDYEQICDTLAKHLHNRWCLQKQAQGWRFGTKHSAREKTTPLMRPWHELPETHKEVDLELPVDFIAIMKRFGYSFVPDKK